jgi:hypothetical protein
MKKTLAILALALFLGGTGAAVYAASEATPAIEVQAEEKKKEKKTTKKAEDASKEKSSDCSKECTKKCDGEKK